MSGWAQRFAHPWASSKSHYWPPRRRTWRLDTSHDPNRNCLSRMAACWIVLPTAATSPVERCFSHRWRAHAQWRFQACGSRRLGISRKINSCSARVWGPMTHYHKTLAPSRFGSTRAFWRVDGSSGLEACRFRSSII